MNLDRHLELIKQLKIAFPLGLSSSYIKKFDDKHFKEILFSEFEKRIKLERKIAKTFFDKSPLVTTAGIADNPTCKNVFPIKEAPIPAVPNAAQPRYTRIDHF